MSKLIDGKYTMGMPFTTGIQYITSDEVIESDTHHTLSTALNTIQGGTFQNGTFTGHLTFGDATGDNITINAGTTTYENNESITLKDNSATAMTFSSTGNSNMVVLNTTNSSEKITMNKTLELINTINGGKMLSIQTNNTTWNFENFYGIFLMRPSLGTVFSIVSPDYNNSCLYISAADSGPMMEVMDSVNSILKIGDSTFGASSVMEIYGINPVIKSTVDSTSITDSNCFNCLGGMTIRKKLYVGTGIYLPTTGGNASQLNYYENSTNFTCIFKSNGVGGTTANVILTFSRVGSIVCMIIPNMSIDANGAYITNDATTYLPTRFRPVHLYNNFTCNTINVGTYLNTGSLTIENSGRLRIYKAMEGNAFSVGAGSGITNISQFTYQV